MKKQTKREMNTMDRVDIFGKKPELILTPKETSLFATVSTSLTTLRAWSAGQVSGKSTYREGAAERRALRRQVHLAMKDIAELAKSMQEEGQIGMAELFRMPRHPTYAELLATAESFASLAEPISAQFVTRGLDATFVADLRALITAFAGATGGKVNGGIDWTAGTAGMAATAAAGMKAVRTLRPIMRVHLKNDPALLAAWNAAARVERARPPEPAPATAPPSGT